MKAEKDFVAFIELLNSHKVRYLIIGGYAYSYHAEPRFTKDIDFFIDRSKANSERLTAALGDFGFADLGLRADDFRQAGRLIQLGYAPLRIDIATSISGVDFSACWKKKVMGRFGGQIAYFISRRDLIKNKTASGRPQDLLDAAKLKALA